MDIDRLIPPEAVADAQEEFNSFEVWPENWDAVRVFCHCTTQWNIHLGFGVLYHQGLDYQAAAGVARDWLGLKLDEELLFKLRVMESELKPLLND